MKKKIFLLIIIILGLIVIYFRYKGTSDSIVETRSEVSFKGEETEISKKRREEKEKELKIQLKNAREENQETKKRNKKILEDREKMLKEERILLEGIKKDILEKEPKEERRKALNSFLKDIDENKRDKYHRENTIPILVDIKEGIDIEYKILVGARLYKLYESTDAFDKAELIKKELNLGGDLDEKTDL